MKSITVNTIAPAQKKTLSIAGASPRIVPLSAGWSVTQDVLNRGELSGIFRREFDQFSPAIAVSPFVAIPRLDYLQVLQAKHPYWGRELRGFNQAPWYYRLEFAAPADARHATLQFAGVDYFAKVWFNEQLVGEHEGYATPFEFEVGHLLVADKPNLLVVRVDAPWDDKVAEGHDDNRCGYIIRNMIKGSYEHMDTFVQRDVNPVGIWKGVQLVVHDGLRSVQTPHVRAVPSEDRSTATVTVAWPVCAADAVSGRLSVRVLSQSQGLEVASVEQSVKLSAGENALNAQVVLENPAMWNTWDRGGAHLYTMQVELATPTGVVRQELSFGVRQIEMRRTQDEVTFLLNGRPIYLRGATYWADVYISRSNASRYERDLRNMIAAGINSIRVHVHVENDEFYDLCDRMGMLVLQDLELNWVYPTDEAFTARAVKVCGDVVKHLRNHPSMACWLTMNESICLPQAFTLGEKLVAMCNELDEGCPTIRNSGDSLIHPDPLGSGDYHDYRGSLCSGETLDIYGSKVKFNTEFGADAPPTELYLRRESVLHKRLAKILPDIPKLQDYQYYLLKYYIEHYRIQKYAPCSGYMQFMWIDFCPQSFYGVYDYWGNPKSAGLGGGLRAFNESNQPLGIFMEHNDAPVALHVVNDRLEDLGQCKAHWLVVDAKGTTVAQGSQAVNVGPDSSVRVCDLLFESLAVCRVTLRLEDASGRVLAENTYENPFDMPKRPKNYPGRMDPELGMRLWWG